jgi:hypothetical protein
MSAQNELFTEEFERWRGEFEQIDDVCIIGMGDYLTSEKIKSKKIPFTLRQTGFIK